MDFETKTWATNKGGEADAEDARSDDLHWMELLDTALGSLSPFDHSIEAMIDRLERHS